MSRRPITVLQVLPALEAGGVERSTLEVAGELARRGHWSLVISAGGRMVEQLEREGSEHIAWPIGRKHPGTIRYVRRLRTLARERSIDILHARSRAPAWVAYLAWRGMPREMRPRFITSVHGLHSVNWYSRIMTRGEVVICVSEAVRRYVMENYPGVDGQRIRTIPHGISGEQFPRGYTPDDAWLDTWRTAYPRADPASGVPIITLPGRITRLKGHHDFLNLMDALTQRGIHATGLIVGGEDPRRRSYAREIRDQAQRRNLSNVIFTGHLADMREIFAISNLVLSLSRKPEAFGRTVLEALSIGTPVVGYDHGGVGEILARLFPEGRVPVGDAAALAGRVLTMLREPPEVRPNDRFLLEKSLEETITVYEEIAADRPVTTA